MAAVKTLRKKQNNILSSILVSKVKNFEKNSKIKSDIQLEVAEVERDAGYLTSREHNSKPQKRDYTPSSSSDSQDYKKGKNFNTDN